MNNNAHHFPMTGYRQNTPSDYRAAGYLKEQSLTTRQTLDTNLAIHTKEGDTVTINSTSYSSLQAYTYDSKGMVQGEAGFAAFSQSLREITLASGQEFTFSVEGDLSDDELEDIKSMLNGLDSVITDMKQGDMEGAMQSALSLGKFDTFSAYSADIVYEQYVEVTTTTAAVANTELSDNSESANAFDSGHKAFKQNSVLNPENIFNKLLEKFSKHEDKLLQAVQSPSNSIFQRHLDELQGGSQQFDSLVDLLEGAMDKFDSFFETISSEKNASNNTKKVDDN